MQMVSVRSDLYIRSYVHLIYRSNNHLSIVILLFKIQQQLNVDNVYQIQIVSMLFEWRKKEVETD